jgi:hypothetical protein
MRVGRLAVLLVVLPLLAAAGCRDRLFGNETNVVVVNDSQCNLTVSVDGWEATTIPHGSTETVDNVGSGRHVLEAKDQMDRLVERRYVELHSGEDYYWRLEGCSAP